MVSGIVARYRLPPSPPLSHFIAPYSLYEYYRKISNISAPNHKT